MSESQNCVGSKRFSTRCPATARKLSVMRSDRRGAKFARYTIVSVLSAVVGLILLGALVWTDALTASWANVVATVVTTVPCFVLYRRWVWHGTDRAQYMGQFMPVLTISIVGLGLSTIAAGAADAVATGNGWSALRRVVAVEAATNATFAVLWVIQFFLLDRGTFRDASVSTSAADLGVARATIVDDLTLGLVDVPG